MTEIKPISGGKFIDGLDEQDEAFESNAYETFAELIRGMPADKSVDLPPSPLKSCEWGKVKFRAGNRMSVANVSEYRQQVRDALDRNPELWIQLLNKMTAIQREWMVARADSMRMQDAIHAMADRRGEPRSLWQNKYKAFPVEIKEAIEFGARLMGQDAINTAIQLKRSYLRTAVMTYVGGLESEDEKTRLETAKTLIEWELGKAGVKITTEGDGKFNSLMERIAAASERAAGMPIEIDGDVIDITPENDEGE